MKAPPEAVPKKMNKFPVLTFENGGHFFVVPLLKNCPYAKEHLVRHFFLKYRIPLKGKAKLLQFPLKSCIISNAVF